MATGVGEVDALSSEGGVGAGWLGVRSPESVFGTGGGTGQGVSGCLIGTGSLAAS